MKKLLCGLSLLAMSAVSHAQQGQAVGPYFVGSFGSSMVDFENVTWPAGTGGSYTKDERDTGWRIGGGYQFSPNGALELSYVNLGEMKQNFAFTAPAGVAGTTLNSKYKADGFAVDFVGTLPVSEQFSLLGRAGAMYSTMKTTATSNSAALTAALAAAGYNMSPERSEWNGRLGIGAQYNFSKTMSARLEWEKVLSVGDSSTGEGDIGFLSVGLQIRF